MDLSLINTLKFLTLLFPHVNKDMSDSELKRKMMKDVYVSSLKENNITPVEFAHALKKLFKHGYIFYTEAYFDPIARQTVIDSFKDKEKFEQLKQELERYIQKIQDESEKALNHHFSNALPKEIKFLDNVEYDKLTVDILIEESIKYIEKLEQGLVARLTLVPVFDMNQLLNDLENGLTLKQATRGKINYDKERRILYIEGNVLDTHEKGNLPVFNYALEQFLEDGFSKEIFYSELDVMKGLPQDEAKSLAKKIERSFRNYMNRMDKHIKTPFIVSSKSVKINPMYLS